MSNASLAQPNIPNEFAVAQQVMERHESVLEEAKLKKQRVTLDLLVDYCSMIRLLMDKMTVPELLEKTEVAKQMMVRVYEDEKGKKSFEKMYWFIQQTEAPYIFDSFCNFFEHKRPKEERFYCNRRKVLMPVVQAIQDLRDDKLDEIFIDLPPRTGKTTIVRLAMLWFGSGDPEKSSLYSAYSDTITKAFYNGMLEFMTDPTYAYKEIYPKHKIVAQSGEYETIDLVRKKNYPTFTFRSIYGTLNGACDCSGLLVSDDLLSGIEEALNPDRLTTVWGKFDNNFIPRAKQKAKVINMGTRWAMKDPQGRRQMLLENEPAYKNRRYRVIAIPALDENDESNFDYPYDLGFSTEYYRQRRASFEANGDMASWLAQYQQEPIDRQGALFAPDSMRFYDGKLPDGKPDRIFMAVDEAFGGGDYVSAPICYQFGEDFYIHDVVFNNGDKEVTRPLIVDAILKHQVQAARFEATATTFAYHEWIEDELLKKGYRCNIETQAASTRTRKVDRIYDKAPEIRRMYFRDSSCRSKTYNMFMSNLYEFKIEGKVKHDDAPDSMAQLCDMILYSGNASEIMESLF